MSVDKHDVGIGWTVQQGPALPSEETLPGQVFHVSQLPDPERQARELGPDYPELYKNVNGAPNPELVIEDRKEAELHPQGPEPHELNRGDVRREIVSNWEKVVEDRKNAQADEAEAAADERDANPATTEGTDTPEAAQEDTNGSV